MELLSEIDRIKSVMGLVLEYKKKLTRDDKFYWVAKNIGGWISDLFFMNNKLIKTIPFYDTYKNYLIVKTKVNVTDLDSVIDSFKTEYEAFLMLLDPQKSEDVIDEFKKQYPVIKEKIDRYGKKEVNPNERRGRKRLDKKPKVTSAIVKGRTDLDMSRLKPLSAVQSAPELEPVSEPTPESGKRGRKKLDRDFTPIEAGRWKLEGIEQLEKIEKRIDKYEAQSTKLTNEIIRLQRELDRRRSFFGIDKDEEINESIQKIKSDFKRFIL
jgi:hypothetical protein